MATGVKPRDEEARLTRKDLDVLTDAMKDKEFRKLLAEYCEEIRDPANQVLYQKEMTQLEKERGVDITFINPKPGYVIKTSVAGDRKAFINICSSENVGKPSCVTKEVDGSKGLDWQVPYSLTPPREDYDKKKQRCVLYDVVFHPDTLRIAQNNKRFRELVNNTAFDALKSTYNIDLDCNNSRFPKAMYKGMTIPAVIRKADPNYKPIVDDEEETADFSPEVLEKLYPQRSYSDETLKPRETDASKHQRVHRKDQSNINGYTTPKYTIKQQKNLDMQDFTFEKDCKQYSAIPSQLVLEINLPLVSSTQECTLDVREKHLSLLCEKPARYKLDVNLPYPVDDLCGNATFDLSKRLLIVTLPVRKSNYKSDFVNSLKLDSGVESEGNSDSQDEDVPKDKLIVELKSDDTVKSHENVEKLKEQDLFLNPNLTYILPSFTHNALDTMIAFTFHVKNTDPESIFIKSIKNNVIRIKFTSIGAGFVPVYYSTLLVFEEGVTFEDVSSEAWDNNVILQLELSSAIPKKCQVGLQETDLSYQYFDMSLVSKAESTETDANKESSDTAILPPVVEVANFGTETNITVTSNDSESETDNQLSPRPRQITWAERGGCESSAKGILRKSGRLGRSLSESSAGDIASSMDYISSDCIPEESSLKKTVRFSNIIAKQFYRYNSSIEGQKKKNQRKKSKKRNLERRKSESEAEDETNADKQDNTSKYKLAAKERRDSGLADTSDAEADSRNTSPPEREKSKPVTCDSIKHTTGLYDPEKLNKGQYLEVNFKNDLIFELDM